MGENIKRKNILRVTLSLTIALVIVAGIVICCICLGSNNLNAKELINTVCYDLGFISEEEYIKGGGTVAKTNANSQGLENFETDYPNNEINISESSSIQQSAFMLVTARELISNDQYKENEFYQTKLSEDANDNLYISYKIKDKSIIVNCLSFNLVDGTYGGLSFVYIVTKNNDGWSISGSGKTYIPEGTKFATNDQIDSNKGCEYGYFETKGKNHNIYYYEYSALSLKNTLEDNKQITSAEQLNTVQFESIDTTTHKKININSSKDDISSEDKIEISNKILNKDREIETNKIVFNKLPNKSNIGQVAYKIIYGE